MKIGIIGTAGRGECGKKLNKNIFKKMVRAAKVEIDNLDIGTSSSSITLVSGGAAWADHIAIILWNRYEEFAGLELHLPAIFIDDTKSPHFFDNGIGDWRKNPGRSANLYHEQFSAKCGIDSLQQIKDAANDGAEIKYSNGFMKRNAALAAECDILIALTFDKDEPASGGTYYTWNKSRAKKIHISIGDL